VGFGHKVTPFPASTQAVLGRGIRGRTKGSLGRAWGEVLSPHPPSRADALAAALPEPLFLPCKPRLLPQHAGKPRRAAGASPSGSLPSHRAEAAGSSRFSGKVALRLYRQIFRHMMVCFKWKQLKKGWENPEPQLPSAGCSRTVFRQPGTAEKALGAPAPGSPPRLPRTGEERSGAPDGILINNNSQLPLRWDKPCCKSAPFPRLSVAFEDLLLLLFISIQSQD